MKWWVYWFHNKYLLKKSTEGRRKTKNQQRINPLLSLFRWGKWSSVPTELNALLGIPGLKQCNLSWLPSDPLAAQEATIRLIAGNHRMNMPSAFSVLLLVLPPAEPQGGDWNSANHLRLISGVLYNTASSCHQTLPTSRKQSSHFLMTIYFLLPRFTRISVFGPLTWS